MFMSICEVCKEEPQFRTVESDFNGQNKRLNVCMDCFYAIEEMEKRERERKEMKCVMCGRTGPKVGNRFFEDGHDQDLCDDCYHETKGDEENQERSQREEW